MNAPFKNLRIRAYLQTGVISDQFLPLDAVLYYHLVRKTMGEEILTKPGESNIRESQGITLPIKKGGMKNEMWFYHCSFAQWPDHAVEDKSFKVKQGDWLRFTEYLSETQRRVDISRGKFKAYHIKMYYRTATYIDWYCVGWPDQIMDLLRFCTHLGKNTGDGWGAVLRWEVTEWPEDWSIRGPQNKLMRAVPLQQDRNGFLYGLRPSYWNPRHQFICKMPEL
jgi:CRISPR type IV-associated protein Csf3